MYKLSPFGFAGNNVPVNEKKIEEETKFLDAKEKELYIKLLISEISKLDKLRSEKLSKN